MVKKLTIGILFLSAALFNLPASAEPLNQTGTATESIAIKAQEDQGRKTAENQNAEAVTGAATDVDSIDTKYLKGYFVDTGKIVAAPVHWETKDWLKLGAVAGVTSSLFLVDQKVKNFAQSHQSHVASGFATVGNDLGNGFYTLPPLGAFYLYGYLADDHKARRASLLALESFAISGIITSGLKMIAERHRPNTGDSSTTWDGPHLSLKNVSFCSGHTASAFSIATVFANEYKDNAYVPPLAYGLATLTGLSRIYSNEHWASDAFFGAALGYFVSKAVLSFHKDDGSKTASRLSIMPSVSKEMTGLSMKYDF